MVSSVPEHVVECRISTSAPAFCICASIQILVDPDTFRGIHSRLSELGGAVLAAVDKMSQAYFACKDLPEYMTARSRKYEEAAPMDRNSLVGVASVLHC